MNMPFGKYRGVEIADLPDDYLSWLLSLGDDLRQPLRWAIIAEWRSRQQPMGAVKALPPPVKTMAEEMVKVGYRTLAHLHHPDHGGNSEAMVTVNLAAEVLRDYLREAA